MLLPREVELFWKRTMTSASVLFLANRYLSILSQAIQNAAMGSMSDKVRRSVMHSASYSPLTYVFSDVREKSVCHALCIPTPSYYSCANLTNAIQAIFLLPYFPSAGQCSRNGMLNGTDSDMVYLQYSPAYGHMHYVEGVFVCLSVYSSSCCRPCR